MKIFSLLVLLIFIGFLGSAAAEYRPNLQDRTSRQSQYDNRHWSSDKRMRNSDFSDSKDEDLGRPERRGRHHHPIHRHRGSFPIVIYRDNTEVPPPPVEEKTTVDQPTRPAPRPLSPQRCAGDTVYSRDKTTGELIIRYVSPAGDC